MVAPPAEEIVYSWGRTFRVPQRRVLPRTVDEVRSAISAATAPVLPFGLGRSYGDSCLNEGGVLIGTERLDRFIRFDAASGTLSCQSGVSIENILRVLNAAVEDDGSGWFVPVVPGTQFVTVGGAIANDVHGKNHRLEGTFGRHVNWLELMRSDEKLVRCSISENRELFEATIGGLGLTGVITAAEIKLQRVPSMFMEVEHVRMRNLDDYFRLAAAQRDQWTHQAAWIDVTSSGRSVGRGIYTRSRFTRGAGRRPAALTPRVRVPFEAPSWFAGRLVIRAFNQLYRRKLLGQSKHQERVPYASILFPLDGIRDWNKLFGSRGFFQYQCVLPPAAAEEGIRALLETIAKSGEGSFLAVLKNFGDVQSPGLLSFPMPGTTLAVDFPNRGESTLRLLDRLDAITSEARGRIYLAKDGRASAQVLRASLPSVERFQASIDPRFSSSIWRRVTAA